MLVSLKTNLIFFASLVLISCNQLQQHNSIKSNGNVITEKRDIPEKFSNIEVSSALEVIITQAEKTEVKVQADDNLQNSIITEVQNGVLIITRKNGSYSSQNEPKVYINAPKFEKITANSASTIKTKNTLKGENISLDASSAAKIEVQLSIDNIKANSSSASKIEIKGLALNFQAESTSASNINAEDLLANNITAESSSGSKIKIHPILSLKAEANSGAKIEYNNNPKQIEKSTSSGGILVKTKLNSR